MILRLAVIPARILLRGFFLALLAVHALPPPVTAATFSSIADALRTPELATHLELRGNDPTVHHLPPELGRLLHLQSLKMQCMEALEDLPEEIGGLTLLEELVIDNGNGCVMNVTLPESISQLRKLKKLVLYGALDSREGNNAQSPARIKSLPRSLADLQHLEELNLGRNGLEEVPPQIAALKNLRTLNLEYNTIQELPEFIGQLDKLRDLSLQSNAQGLRLPDSLARLPGLRLNMGNSFLALAEQQALRRRFPSIIFDFANDSDDAAANAEDDASEAEPPEDQGLREQVIWDRGQQLSPLVCQTRRDLTEDDEPQAALRCWVRQGDANHVLRGRLVFHAPAWDFPLRLQVLSPQFLLCSMSAGTGQRHLVLDGSAEIPRVIVEETGKGSMTVINGMAGEVALLHEDFVKLDWSKPDKAQISCWPAGRGEMRYGEVPWTRRFAWLREHCWQPESPPPGQ